MSLFGILVVVAVIAAIPTSGLSLVALFFARIWINSQEGEKIAAASINSRSTDNSVSIPFVSAAGCRKFFKKYGSTEHKFKALNMSPMTYLGYVKVADNTEHVVMVNWSGSMTYVTSLMPPYQYGNDFLSLMQKKTFLDGIIESLSPAAGTT